MKISLNWLKDYIDTDLSVEQIDDKLTLAGLEVEGVEHIGSKLHGVVVGKVLTCEDHPNADRLKVCNVDIGTEDVSIICGAPNVAAGQTVPVATVGTTLPVTDKDGKHLTLRKAKIRGVHSYGMICAEDELGLSNDHSGIMVLDDSFKPGTPFSEVWPLYEDDVFEIALTPNRPDAASHIGVARDLTAVENLPLKKPEVTIPNPGSEVGEKLGVEIKNPEKCHRYVAKVIEDVTISESPDWLKNRLKTIGLRPVNNVVDATNYVLHEMGQPLHAFDYDRVAGKKIVVQSFDKKTKFTTLDDVERDVSADGLFICDGEKPVALAGIMGGGNSEIHSGTKTVLLESAYFEPVGIRKTSKALALQTDASYRFERGIDPNVTLVAAERCAKIIADIAGGNIVDGYIDEHPVKTIPEKLTLRISYLNKVLGTEFKLEDAAEILRRLEINVENKDKDTITCLVPTFRPDIEREIDLIEEVARIFDYNKIPAPEFVRYIRPAPLPFSEIFTNKVKTAARSLGFQEIFSNSLLPDKASKFADNPKDIISTLNPISRDQALLRPDLLYGFLRSAAWNFNRSSEAVRFFEVGDIFQRSDNGTYLDGVLEEAHLLLGISGFKHVEHWRSKPEQYSFFDLKESVNGFLKSLGLVNHVIERQSDNGLLLYFLDDTHVGTIQKVSNTYCKHFEIDYPAYAAEFSLTRLARFLEQQPDRIFTDISKFPTIDYDIAFVLDKNVSSGDLENTIREVAGDRLIGLRVFDVYEGESVGDDKKSIAYRLLFLDKSKTLTISDVEPIIQKITKLANKRFSAKLRS